MIRKRKNKSFGFGAKINGYLCRLRAGYAGESGRQVKVSCSGGAPPPWANVIGLLVLVFPQGGTVADSRQVISHGMTITAINLPILNLGSFLRCLRAWGLMDCFAVRFFMPDSYERSPTKTINDTWYRNFAQLMYLDLQIFHFLVLDVDFMLIAVTNSINDENF